jgi:hypothetical protein
VPTVQTRAQLSFLTASPAAVHGISIERAQLSF